MCIYTILTCLGSREAKMTIFLHYLRSRSPFCCVRQGQVHYDNRALGSAYKANTITHVLYTNIYFIFQVNMPGSTILYLVVCARVLYKIFKK